MTFRGPGLVAAAGLTALAALAAGSLSAAGRPVQAAVPVTDDPHYKRLLYTAHLRLFEVALPPAGATLDHTHDHDVATLALSAATTRTREAGGDWGAARTHAPGAVDIAEHTGRPAAHRRENTGSGPFRALAFENLRDGGWSMPRLIQAAGTTLAQETRAFAVYDVRLTTTTVRTAHVHQMPTVVVLIAGAVEVQGGGGESEFRMDAPGRWFSSQGDQPHALSLASGTDARLVEIEAR